MGFFRRFLRTRDAEREVKAWQEAWAKAVANPDRHAVSELRGRLERLSAPDGDLEIEREMLEALEHVVDFAAAVAESGLPAIATGHRVVGTDVCHFTAPVSMPDDPAQPSGRLLLTKRASDLRRRRAWNGGRLARDRATDAVASRSDSDPHGRDSALSLPLQLVR